MARNKHGNKKNVVDGIKFDSIKESNHYLKLKFLEKQGLIKNLVIKPVYVIFSGYTDYAGKKRLPIKFEPDFKYFDVKLNKTVIDEVKAFCKKEKKFVTTAVYKLKKKMFLKIIPENTIFNEI